MRAYVNKPHPDASLLIPVDRDSARTRTPPEGMGKWNNVEEQPTAPDDQPVACRHCAPPTALQDHQDMEITIDMPTSAGYKIVKDAGVHSFGACGEMSLRMT